MKSIHPLKVAHDVLYHDTVLIHTARSIEFWCKSRTILSKPVLTSSSRLLVENSHQLYYFAITIGCLKSSLPLVESFIALDRSLVDNTKLSIVPWRQTASTLSHRAELAPRALEQGARTAVLENHLLIFGRVFMASTDSTVQHLSKSHQALMYTYIMLHYTALDSGPSFGCEGVFNWSPSFPIHTLSFSVKIDLQYLHSFYNDLHHSNRPSRGFGCPHGLGRPRHRFRDVPLDA